MLFSISTILPFTVCLFWLAVFLLDWREGSKARRVLTVFMATSTALYFCHGVFFNNDTTLMPWADSVYAFCNLGVFPMYFLYVCRLTDSSPVFRKGLLFLFPAALMFLWTVAENVFGGGEISETRLIVMRTVFVLQIFPICYLGFKRLKRFDALIDEYYSNTEFRSVKQTRQLMLVLLVCSVCSGAANHVGRDFFSDHPSLLILPSAVFAVLLFAVGFVGLKQTFSIDDLEKEAFWEEDETVGEDSADALTDETAGSGARISQRMTRLLETLMLEERLYLQPDLRLADLAVRMKIGRSTLSAFINQSQGMSFSDYVNALRIRHAQDIMRADDSHALSIIQISEQSGFTNERSFYRAFSKIEGLTPKQWLQKEWGKA